MTTTTFSETAAVFFVLMGTILGYLLGRLQGYQNGRSRSRATLAKLASNTAYGKSIAVSAYPKLPGQTDTETIPRITTDTTEFTLPANLGFDTLVKGHHA